VVKWFSSKPLRFKASRAYAVLVSSTATASEPAGYGVTSWTYWTGAPLR
jgi:hypothetical protein